MEQDKQPEDIGPFVTGKKDGKSVEGNFKVKGAKDYWKCPFPGCPRTFEFDPKIVPMCKEHRRFMGDVIFTLQSLGLITVSMTGEISKTGGLPPQAQSQAKQKPADAKSLFIPKPGQGDAAVREARDIAAKGKPQ